jgi:hypothetical protein
VIGPSVQSYKRLLTHRVKSIGHLKERSPTCYFMRPMGEMKQMTSVVAVALNTDVAYRWNA